MEPVTHALASLTLGRAGLGRITRQAAPMLLVSGLAADLDWISYTAGAPSFLRWHHTASHSLLAAAAIAILVAAGFWLWGCQGETSQRLRYWPALAVCGCGAAMHVLLDLPNDSGVMLLWPFRARWFAWDLAPEVEPALLAILLAGLLIPSLLNLVGEEIGARKRRRPGARGALVALCLAAAYMGGRAVAHRRADVLVNSHTYRQEAPIRTGAFPTASPLLWRGVVETETAIHEAEISLAPGVEFDADAARNLFKPDDSSVLRQAAASNAARKFLAFARFPLARVQPLPDGFEVQIRDLREPAGTAAGTAEIVAVIMLNARQEVTHSDLEFAAEAQR
jgi:inner membrane protein